jgi:ankyrin repeat protein
MPLHSRYARKKRPARSPDDALVLAARRGDIGGLRAALDAGAANLGEALARAIRSDRPLAVAYLLDRGADPNALIWFGQFFEMPLIFAVACGRIACAEALVDHGAWLAACQDQPLGPLHWAVENGSLRMMRALLARGADVNDGTWDNYHWGEELWEGLTCLEIAARRNRLGIARALLDAGARTEPPADREEAGPPGSGRSTALEDAARHPQGDKLFQLLLERGATDPDGRALAIAVERGDVAKAKLLLAAGAPIQQRPLNKLREKLLFRGEATRRHDARPGRLARARLQAGSSRNRGASVALAARPRRARRGFFRRVA